MSIYREEDRGKWYISEETSSGSFVQSQETEIFQNCENRYFWASLDFSCNLKTDFYNLQRISKYYLKSDMQLGGSTVYLRRSGHSSCHNFSPKWNSSIFGHFVPKIFGF